MGFSVTAIRTNLHMWTCCNQIQQYSPFIIYAMWLMFNKKADHVNSEPHTNQTVVSLLDHFRPPAASPAVACHNSAVICVLGLS